MCSTSSFSSIPQLQIHIKCITTPFSSKPNRKNFQRTHFSLFIPLPNNHFGILKLKEPTFVSSSFPSNLSLPSLGSKQCKNRPFLQSQIVVDSPEEDLVDVEKVKSEIELKGRRVFMEEPSCWVKNGIFVRGLKLEFKEKEKEKEIEREKYGLLRKRQIKAETEAWEKMVEEYREFVRGLREKKLAPNLPKVKALFMSWFEPMK